MRASMSATGSVNLIVCFSSATRSLRALRRTCSGLLSKTGRWSLVLGRRPTQPLLLIRFSYRRSSLLALTINDERPTTALPGRLRNPGDLSLKSQPAETQPADAKLAQESARASANLAAVVLARRELGLLCVLYSFCCCGHAILFSKLETWNLKLSML
jgi:hypothetical protein